MDVETGTLREFTHAECRFAYRESVFKQDLKDRYIITRVRFRLLKKPAVKTTYGDILRELEAMHVAGSPTPSQVSQAVIAIRSRKLPDPAQIGNAGSFFKNPVVSVAQSEALHAQFPALVSYPQADGVKLAAGWLIEQAGWKGRRIGPVGTYEKQALVLVNHGGAVGAEVMTTARAVQAAVQEKFGVLLEMEPRVY
jgi:UDP-N-acetylmuramate dehydrogenase